MPEAENRVSKARTAGKNGVASASRPHPVCDGEEANQATAAVTDEHGAIQARYAPALSVIELARHARRLWDTAHITTRRGYGILEQTSLRAGSRKSIALPAAPTN